MSLTNKALFVIERNLDHDLSLGEIADACGVSRFHLAHAFGEVTGKAVMEYVRARRLSEAARKLARGADDILALALDSSYASHEAFTRAFRAQFGVTPEDARRDGAALALIDPLPFVETRRIALPPPRFEQLGELKFVGLGQSCAHGRMDHIPAQWQRFMRDFYAGIANRLQEMPTGVSTRGQNDDEMVYVSAAGVSAFGAVAQELMRVVVPPARYAVFVHDGHVTELPQTYAAIWDNWFPTSGHAPAEASGIERHNPAFDPRTGNGGITIWVALA
jgi:AraC family transcriptional regulator